MSRALLEEFTILCPESGRKDKVDASIVDFDFTLEELGLPSRHRRRRPRERMGLRLRLPCTACHYERVHAEARWMYEALLRQAPRNGLPRDLRETYVENVEEELAELRHPDRSAILSRLTSLPVYQEEPDGEGGEVTVRGQPVLAARKIGRNDPYPCFFPQSI